MKTSLAISLGTLLIALSLDVASTSRIGMGVVIVGGTIFSLILTLILFDGFNQNRAEKVAKLEIENSQIAIEQQNKTLESQMNSAFQSYLTNLELVQLEEKNEAIAKQNSEITLEKFRIGTITTLEFRTAQLNYINAKVRNTNTQYQAKLSEIALKELAGNLGF